MKKEERREKGCGKGAVVAREEEGGREMKARRNTEDKPTKTKTGKKTRKKIENKWQKDTQTTRQNGKSEHNRK